MSGELKNKKIAVLATDGFEYVELVKPRQALLDAGAQVDVISPKEGKIRGWDVDKWGDEVEVDVPLSVAKAEDYDGLVLPGGVLNPDHLRQNENAVKFVRSFFESQKPVGAICHGPWMLVEAEVVRGRQITSWPSLKTDIRNAGGKWVDEQVVTDQGLVTSRKPDDIPAFNRKLIEEFAEGKHKAQHA